MDIYMIRENEKIKAGDVINVEGKNGEYLITSDLNGENKRIIGKYGKETNSEILDNIAVAIESNIRAEKVQGIYFELPGEGENNG